MSKASSGPNSELLQLLSSRDSEIARLRRIIVQLQVRNKEQRAELAILRERVDGELDKEIDDILGKRPTRTPKVRLPNVTKATDGQEGPDGSASSGTANETVSAPSNSGGETPIARAQEEGSSASNPIVKQEEKVTSHPEQTQNKPSAKPATTSQPIFGFGKFGTTSEPASGFAKFAATSESFGFGQRPATSEPTFGFGKYATAPKPTFSFGDSAPTTEFGNIGSGVPPQSIRERMNVTGLDPYSIDVDPGVLSRAVSARRIVHVHGVKSDKVSNPRWGVDYYKRYYPC